MRMKSIFAALALVAATSGAAFAEDTFVTLMTGSTAGTYHLLGSAIAKAVSAATKLHVTPMRSAGSAENIALVADGGPEIAFAQNDITHWAMTGQGSFAGEAKTNLRAIAALYPEHVQMITRAGSEVRSFADLKGHRVGVGAVGSGVEADARAIFRVLGLSYADMNAAFTDFRATMKRLQGGTLEAGMIVAGVPTPAVTELASSEPIALVGLTRDELDRLASAHPYFEAALIPAGTYGIETETLAPAVRALLVTRSDVPDDVIYSFTKALFEHLDDIREAHDVAGEISLERAAARLTAPLHPGAARYYREAGVEVD